MLKVIILICFVVTLIILDMLNGEGNFKANAMSTLVFGGSTVFILFIMQRNQMLRILLILILLWLSLYVLVNGYHYFMERIRERQNSATLTLLLFICFHLMFTIEIIIVSHGIELDLNHINQWVVDHVLNGTSVQLNELFLVFVFVFVFLYIPYTGSKVVPLTLDIIYKKVDRYSEKLDETLSKNEDLYFTIFVNEVKAGKWIGILERLLMLIFIINDQLSAIGVIIAIKSLARFKMMDNKIFAEYYLLGTLISVTFTFVVFGLFKRLLLM